MLSHGGRLKFKKSKDDEESTYLRRIQRQNSQHLVIDRHGGFDHKCF